MLCVSFIEHDTTHYEVQWCPKLMSNYANVSYFKHFIKDGIKYVVWVLRIMLGGLTEAWLY